MRRNWITIVLLIAPLFANAQTMECFIDDFKKEYDSKLTELSLAGVMVYVPSVMNIVEDYHSWMNLSLSERKDSLWYILHKPILANDFAIDIQTGEYYLFPEGWLYHNKDSLALNHFVKVTLAGSHEEDVLKEYIQENTVEYIFSVVNLGDGGINGKYWMIENDQLYILVYDNIADQLYPVNALSFLTENNDCYRTFEDWGL